MSPGLSRIDRLFAQPGCQELDGILISDPANRRYLSGFTGSNGYLLVTRGQRWLVTDFRYVEQAGRQSPDFGVVRYQGNVWATVADILRGAGIHAMGFEAGSLTVEQWTGLAASCREMAWTGLGPVVETVRMVKDSQEIAWLKRAAETADDALDAVRAMIRPGVSERAIALELELAMRRAGAERLAFSTIVASGPRGALPHAEPGDRRLTAGDLVIIDFGATVNGYHSDQTVTYAIGPTGPERARQRQIYDIVWEAQARGLAVVRPGVTAAEIDRACRSVIERAGYGAAFGHASGHGIGLAVHEPPILRDGVSPETMCEPGMVITVEPGIYLPGVGGVRLEDTVVVTAGGAERVTRADKAWQELG
ncbi:MAG: Xaa-Pro peptidase family protein [Thermaerobacter sp.]|nr:Xaa-Pro peptidase family protein [Thermaerobacter sp.]